MSTHAAEVVVTGGGIGGTVTALLLARIGASVTLLERRGPGPPPARASCCTPTAWPSSPGSASGPPWPPQAGC
jgi:2-polyprenyl-6-methoxyphenol hydroxylase-like FAD-dependent oxidoreductase